MKRLSPRHKPVLDQLPLLVGEQRTLFLRDLLPKLVETLFHDPFGNRRIRVMDRHLEKPAVEKFALHSRRRGVREEALFRLDPEDAQSGLISRDENVKIQRMFGRPRYQLFRRITPTQPERGLDDRLRVKAGGREKEVACQSEDADLPDRFARRSDHGRIIPPEGGFRKPRTLRRGFALVEATMAMSILSVVGLLLLKLSLNVIYPRQYALQQVLSDSYLTFERARAERIPFESLMAFDSPWPAYPGVATEDVEIGKMPGGATVTGTVVRTRIADSENYPIDGGIGTVASNPAAMKVWRVQSILRYEIADRTYVKSRTLVRAQ